MSLFTRKTWKWHIYTIFLLKDDTEVFSQCFFEPHYPKTWNLFHIKTQDILMTKNVWNQNMFTRNSAKSGRRTLRMEKKKPDTVNWDSMAKTLCCKHDVTAKTKQNNKQTNKHRCMQNFFLLSLCSPGNWVSAPSAALFVHLVSSSRPGTPQTQVSYWVETKHSPSIPPAFPHPQELGTAKLSGPMSVPPANSALPWAGTSPTPAFKHIYC